MIFRRAVHTRAKKIHVQLLKSFPGIGIRGQVVEVSEGLMRNKLHPLKGAAYLVKGQALRIPEPSEQELLAARARDTVADSGESVDTTAASDQPSMPPISVLNFLRFPTAVDAKTSGDTKAAENSGYEEAPEPKIEGWENKLLVNLDKEKVN